MGGVKKFKIVSNFVSIHPKKPGVQPGKETGVMNLMKQQPGTDGPTAEGDPSTPAAPAVHTNGCGMPWEGERHGRPLSGLGAGPPGLGGGLRVFAPKGFHIQVSGTFIAPWLLWDPGSGGGMGRGSDIPEPSHKDTPRRKRRFKLCETFLAQKRGRDLISNQCPLPSLRIRGRGGSACPPAEGPGRLGWTLGE